MFHLTTGWLLFPCIVIALVMERRWHVLIWARSVSRVGDWSPFNSLTLQPLLARKRLDRPPFKKVSLAAVITNAQSWRSCVRIFRAIDFWNSCWSISRLQGVILIATLRVSLFLLILPFEYFCRDWGTHIWPSDVGCWPCRQRFWFFISFTFFLLFILTTWFIASMTRLTCWNQGRTIFRPWECKRPIVISHRNNLGFRAQTIHSWVVFNEECLEKRRVEIHHKILILTGPNFWTS